MDEVLRRELLSGLIRVKAQSSSFGADRIRRRRAPVGEALKHPTVEFTLG